MKTKSLAIHFASLVFSLVMMMSLSGCNIVNIIKEKLGIISEPLPAEVKQEMKQADDGKLALKSPGELAKENSELLAEMIEVVFNETEISNKVNFGELANSLNQGASLEGVYHGLVMGSRYRSLESKSQAASTTLLKAFAVEMAELQDTMKNPTEFLKEEAKKAPSIEFPDGNSAAGDIPTAAPRSQEVKAKKPKAQIGEEMLETFIGASSFTLKRVLCDEALKKIDEVKGSPGELSQWYASFVLRMIKTQVNFGLDQRSNSNFDFHFKFAEHMALDRVKWEVLNRYQRYLNSVVQ